MAAAPLASRCWCSRWRKEGRAPLLVMLWGAAGLASFLTAVASLQPEPEPVGSRVVELTGSNWSLLLQGQWMVEFYAPWCPACQQMELAWEAFARNSVELELSVGKVDVTQEPGVSGRFLVTTLPTIYHAKDGVFRRYRGSRTLEDLEGYILERKWETVEPVAGWKSPSSLIMYGMAGLFHLSGWIRQIHNYFTGTLGIHTWGSYAIFVLATLLIGLILALILVLLIDCICPSKSKEEGFDPVDPDENKIEEQQQTLELSAGDKTPEKGLSDEEGEEEGEDESQANSSDDSAVEGSEKENDLDHFTSDKLEKTSLRQRKNQMEPEL
ncbi:thioredoxin-related transmembrane protein 1 [Python bivittatus]|uniref:Thioredoxin-related transmembrane protein 1 n=1 Tax=Python bivittatus TaxID=176946 RepID=A0A9F2QAN6_PYTBI|nr:thioredoxin-related transmembrane protein 1 [Python bivittatus]